MRFAQLSAMTAPRAWLAILGRPGSLAIAPAIHSLAILPAIHSLAIPRPSRPDAAFQQVNVCLVPTGRL
jgi:hypothetical protein